MVEEQYCYELYDAVGCQNPACTWTLYDPTSPENGGFCNTAAGMEGRFCNGTSGRRSESVIDSDTSDVFSSVATTIADALEVISKALPDGTSDHRTQPLLDLDEAIFNMLGTDFKVRATLHSPRLVVLCRLLPADRTDNAARSRSKGFADNCVTLIADLKGGDVLDLLGIVGDDVDTSTMSDQEKEDKRTQISDFLNIPEVI
jgi:hypothetical protein